MNSFKFQIFGVSLLLLTGVVSTTWSQSQTPARDGAAATKATGKQVTLTLVRWPFT